MRRVLTCIGVCVLSARLLSACGDGNVTGQNPVPDDGGTPFPIMRDDADVDAWTELFDDTGTKGNPDAAPPDGPPSDVPPRTDSARTDGPPAPDPCATRNDGTWCAGLLGLPTPGLLRCTSNRSAGIIMCANGCLDRAGATDACLDDTVDPCFNERDGLYCGRTIGSGTRPNDAFRCMNRRTTWTGPCTGGCAMAAVGITCAQ